MKFGNETLIRWELMVCDYLGNAGYDHSDVTTGAFAWDIAHRCGITKEAYEDRSVVDAHIKTALQKIFPHAVFSDKYTY